MGEGLRKHWHIPFCEKIIEYDDHVMGCHVRKAYMRCMICQKELKPEYYYSPLSRCNEKGIKALNKNKRKRGEQK